MFAGFSLSLEKKIVKYYSNVAAAGIKVSEVIKGK